MVVFRVQRSACRAFLVEAPCATRNDALIRSLCSVFNLRLRLAALVEVLEDVARGGTSALDGQTQIESADDERTKWKADASAGVQHQDVLLRVAMDAKAVLDSSQTLGARRVCSTESELLEKLQHIRSAVAQAFPMGLPPPHHLMQRLLDAESTEKALSESAAALDVLSGETAELWWAGKRFTRDTNVCDVVGKNDKSTIIVTLQKKGEGAPRRESAVHEDERKAMTAFCCQKQQTQQQQQQQQCGVEDEAEDYYKLSSWADPTMLKKSLRGTENIRPF
ncbi:unnamed protein product [Hyaloperonospora brassicae]|uniref:Uncharacterized protein n=1 Tax=Hyaloperonospora brassicae TaxID=162125 RepID=A0AAV0TUQ8_HYABA|nr:unnamed protein product [Hyaloperonospora brassicae]